jgi:putative nucleotidyltransferase with HDIG domain
MQPLAIGPSSKDKSLDGERAPGLTGDALLWYQHKLAEHAQRTALLARALARRSLLSEEEMRLVHLAALLHDIGKVAIPAAILDKPGPLTEQEWTVMRRHPEIGYSMLVRAGGAWACIAPLVLAHHERWDGRGYPYGLAREDIPSGARILAVVDAFAAMTEQRPYRQTLSPEEAREEVRRGAGSCFDPSVVEVMLSLLDDSSDWDFITSYKAS